MAGFGRPGQAILTVGRRPLPDPANRVDCEACGKPTNMHGYAGAECQCGVRTGHAFKGSHSTGPQPTSR